MMRAFSLSILVTTSLGLVLAACGPTIGEGDSAAAADSMRGRLVPPEPNAPLGDTAAGPVTLDKTSYDVDKTVDGITFTVIARYVNHTDSAVFIARCGADVPSYVMQSLTASEWTTVLRPPCPAVMAAPIQVAPQGHYIDTLVVRASTRVGVLPRLETADVAGIYRLLFDLYSRSWDSAERPGDDALLPVAQRTSTPFVLRE